MVTVRRLDDSEAEQVFGRQDRIDMTEYQKTVREMEPGVKYGLQPSPPEITHRAFRRRLTRAANAAGVKLKWGRAGGDQSTGEVYVHVLPPQAQE